ncbi:hypothetical protein BCR37DRAFT_388625 [Protomyces lactucae-debilis]|uniref:Uncharacterized protein n=1 Tax=Protomyces lactucae-debilis TaxID=2754530 RepID=A0A1Y2F6R1_PROLT|nr:uncharacterized protein BCR37DRAFT_388625 [Protomyces lactucae-debilis]ORY79016.1 hypothetical protein BCR37DRAFT_388625 [Protomyces lactucae-debilis]
MHVIASQAGLTTPDFFNITETSHLLHRHRLPQQRQRHTSLMPSELFLGSFKPCAKVILLTLLLWDIIFLSATSADKCKQVKFQVWSVHSIPYACPLSETFGALDLQCLPRPGHSGASSSNSQAFSSSSAWLGTFGGPTVSNEEEALHVCKTTCERQIGDLIYSIARNVPDYCQKVEPFVALPAPQWDVQFQNPLWFMDPFDEGRDTNCWCGAEVILHSVLEQETAMKLLNLEAEPEAHSSQNGEDGLPHHARWRLGFPSCDAGDVIDRFLSSQKTLMRFPWYRNSRTLRPETLEFVQGSAETREEKEIDCDAEFVNLFAAGDQSSDYATDESKCTINYGNHVRARDGLIVDGRLGLCCQSQDDSDESMMNGIMQRISDLRKSDTAVKQLAEKGKLQKDFCVALPLPDGFVYDVFDRSYYGEQAWLPEPARILNKFPQNYL